MTHRKPPGLVALRLRPLVAIALALALVPWAGTAWAQEPPPAGERTPERVAILKLNVLGISHEVEAQFRDALREGLGRRSLLLVPAADVEAKLARDPGLSACLNLSCYARAALILGVKRVLEGEILRPQRQTYSVRLQLRELSTGRLTGPPEVRRCDICSVDEAQQMLGEVGMRIGALAVATPPDRAPDPPGTLQVESQPPGAQVLIDGRLQLDKTPATYLLPVGVHSLELRRMGFRSLRRPVEIAATQHQIVNLELIPIPPRRPWLTALSVIGAVGAAGLAVTSGVLFSFHGRPAYGLPEYEVPCLPPQAHCMKKYDNLPQGIVTAVGAGVLAIGAGVAIYFDHASPRRRIVIAPGLAPAEGGK